MQGNLDKAIAAFRKATVLKTDFAAAYCALGVCYAVKGSYLKAVKYLKIAHNIDRIDPHIIKNIAQTYILKGSFEDSVELLENYIKENPFDWEAHDRLAFSYFKLGEYRRSLSVLQRLAKSCSSSNLHKYAAALNNMGVVYLRMGQPSVAEEVFYKSLEISPEPIAIPYYNLAKLHIGLGKHKEAKKLIDEYISIAPGDNTPFILLSSSYIGEGEYNQAKEIVDSILKKDPESRDARIVLSLLNTEVYEEYDSEIDFLEKELAKGRFTQKELADDRFGQYILNNLAYCYLKKGNIDKARDILDNINWGKAGFPLYATKGLLKILEGEVKEGMCLYNIAVGHAPIEEIKNHVRQKREIEVARYYASRGEKGKALRHLNSALSIKTRARIYLDQAYKLQAQL